MPIIWAFHKFTMLGGIKVSGIRIENRVYDLETKQYLYDAEFTGIGGHTVRRMLSAKDICNPDYMVLLAREHLGDLSCWWPHEEAVS